MSSAILSLLSHIIWAHVQYCQYQRPSVFSGKLCEWLINHSGALTLQATRAFIDGYETLIWWRSQFNKQPQQRQEIESRVENRVLVALTLGVKRLWKSVYIRAVRKQHTRGEETWIRLLLEIKACLVPLFSFNNRTGHPHNVPVTCRKYCRNTLLTVEGFFLHRVDVRTRTRAVRRYVCR